MSKGKSPQIFFILAALTLAAGTGATIFQWSEIGDKWDKLAELKKNVRDPKDIQAEFDETTTKVTKSKADLDHLEQGVPAFAYVPTMLKELETFGKQNGIEVLGIRPIPKADAKDKSGKKKKEAYEEIAIEVKGRGAFKSVQSFITALEKFPKIISARSVTLMPKEMAGQAPGQAQSNKQLDVTLELRAFLFAPDKDQEKSAAELATQSGPTGQTNQTSQTAPTKPGGPNSEKANLDAKVTTTQTNSIVKPASTAAVKVATVPVKTPAKAAPKVAAKLAQHPVKKPVRRMMAHRKLMKRGHLMRRRARR